MSQRVRPSAGPMTGSATCGVSGYFFLGVTQASLPFGSLPTVPPPLVQAATAAASLTLMALKVFDLVPLMLTAANAASAVSVNAAKATPKAHNIAERFIFPSLASALGSAERRTLARLPQSKPATVDFKIGH